jgi:Holliday junction resolvase RusA-like endonuclease
MNSFAVSVPMPPSANMMFATDFKTKRRFRSKVYTAWRDSTAKAVKVEWQRQGAPKFEPPLALTIHLGLNYQSDIDNRIKPLLDLLDKSIPDFPNDRYIDRIEVERVKGLDGARLLIVQGAPT